MYSPVFAGTTGASYARYFFVFVAASCFLYANFRVWCDEYVKVVSGSPGFSLVIEQMHYEFSPANQNTAFIFAVGILNRGAPSITRGWKGVFEINGVSEPMNPINISGQWVIRVGNQSVTLRPEDQITAKTFERRVETGEGKVGRILFTLQGDRTEQIKSLQFCVVISFADFLGKFVSQRFMPDPRPLRGVDTYPTELGQILAAGSESNPNPTPVKMSARNEQKAEEL